MSVLAGVHSASIVARPPQGRANRRQPFRSVCTRASAAAASRRSPPMLVLHMRVSFPILLSLFLFGCSESDWDMVSKQDVPSPDGRHIATVFEMCSYNTTGYWPQLSLRRPGQKLGSTGNVLSCGPGGVITAHWVSAHDLAVEFRIGEEWHPPSATNIDGVTVTFTHNDMRGGSAKSPHSTPR